MIAPPIVPRICPKCGATLQPLSGADGYAVHVVIVGYGLSGPMQEKKRLDTVFACPRCEYAE